MSNWRWEGSDKLFGRECGGAALWGHSADVEGLRVRARGEAGVSGAE